MAIAYHPDMFLDVSESLSKGTCATRVSMCPWQRYSPML